jgi:putative phage-type endonuclease
METEFNPATDKDIDPSKWTDKQRSDGWFDARRGLVTASKIKDLAKRQKNGSFYATRETYKNQLIAEIITGVSIKIPTNDAMQHGIDTEDAARLAYQGIVWDEVSEAAFVKHSRILRSGASPDALVGAEGLLEIKCPTTVTHVLTLRENKMPDDHIYQVQWQMACTGRKYCDFMSFDPRLPEQYRIYLERIDRDDLFIAQLEEMVVNFLAEVDEEIKKLETSKFNHLEGIK